MNFQEPWCFGIFAIHSVALFWNYLPQTRYRGLPWLFLFPWLLKGVFECLPPIVDSIVITFCGWRSTCFDPRERPGFMTTHDHLSGESHNTICILSKLQLRLPLVSSGKKIFTIRGLPSKIPDRYPLRRWTSPNARFQETKLVELEMARSSLVLRAKFHTSFHLSPSKCRP